MSKAENAELWAQQDTPNYGNSYSPPVSTTSKKWTFGEKWVPIISLGILPLCCAAIFAVQGSPRVLQWIIKMISSLF